MGSREKAVLMAAVVYGLGTGIVLWVGAGIPALADPPSRTLVAGETKVVDDRPGTDAAGQRKIAAPVRLAVAQSESPRPGSAAPEKAADNRAEQRSIEDFLRVRRDDKARPVALETAIVQYRLPGKNAAPVGVDLVAAVHVGERSYYEELNRRFAQYDAVLFELVAPEDFRVPEGAKLESQTAVSFLQKTLQSLLGLEFQLQAVDYSRPNFVHADMSPQELAETMQRRGESFWQIFWKLLRHGLEKQAKRPSKTSDAEILLALFRQDRVVLKRILAEEISGTDEALAALSGDDGSSTIITERNKKALEVLRRELDGGKKRIAIFYGAGHLPDMEARLIRQFRAERQKTEWIVAWDLQADHSPAAKSAK